MKRKPQPQNLDPEPSRVVSSFFRPQSNPPSSAEDREVDTSSEWTGSGDPRAGQGSYEVAGDEALGDQAAYPEGDGTEPLAEAPAGEADGETYAEAETQDATAPSYQVEHGSVYADPEVSGWLRVVGVFLALAGLGLGVASITLTGPAHDLLEQLSDIGIGSRSLVVAGIALFAVGLVQRELARRAVAETRRYQGLERSLRQLAQLGAARPQGGDSPADAMRVDFDRLDEKIANLTRATKLYGTPLLEISNQVSELQNRVQDLAGMESRLGEQLAGQPTGGPSEAVIAELQRAIEGSRDRAVEAGTLAKRAADAVEEMQFELLRVLQSGQEDLRRAIGDSAERNTRALGEGFEKTAKTLEQAAAARPASPTPSVDLGPLAQTLAQVQHQVASLATSLARLEARPIATAHAPAAAATGTASPAAPAVTPMGSTLATAESPAAASAPASPTPASQEAAPAKIAGSKQAPSKNVLGAIAKLKSMRG